MKVACVVGTRPGAIKVAPVVHRLRTQPERFETVLLATSQHRHMLDQTLKVFGLKPDEDLDLMAPDQSPMDVTCRAVPALVDFVHRSKPDILLTQGDTATAMAAALACFYTGVTLGHVEAGLRTGNLQAPYPEEFHRRVVDMVSAQHFALTERAAANLRREGVDAKNIHITGNTSIDALRHVLENTTEPAPAVPGGQPYILMTCHRREIFGAGVREVFSAVRSFAQRNPGITIWYPVHPNPNVLNPAHEMLDGLANVLLAHPMSYDVFVHAMKGARFILSDSGGVQEEAPALGKPVLVLRDETERPEAVEAGSSMLVGPHREKIEAAMDLLLNDRQAYEAMAQVRMPFGDGHAAERIVDILDSQR